MYVYVITYMFLEIYMYKQDEQKTHHYSCPLMMQEHVEDTWEWRQAETVEI